MTNYRIAYLLAILGLSGGAYLSLTQGDWSWFSRSGAFLVVIGILLTSREIFEHGRELRHRRLVVDARLHHRMYDALPGHRSTHDWANDRDKKALLRSRHQEEDLWLGESRGLLLLVWGTLIWGFGDLINLL